MGLQNMKRQYMRHATKLSKWCTSLSNEIGEVEFDCTQYWVDFVFLRQDVERVIDLLIRIDEKYSSLKDPFLKLAPHTPSEEGQVQDVMTEISEEYARTKSDSLMQAKQMSREEIERIEEAYHNLVENCYWSAVVNSAVALESRLFFLLKRRSKKTLEAIKPDLKFTLGHLADIYLNNKGKFKNFIPLQHEHLLKLINQYRIISAHPKQFKVDKKTADAIFNFTLSFLLDEGCKLPKPRKHKKARVDIFGN